MPRLCAVCGLLLALVSCNRNADIPQPGSKHYQDLISAFYVGLAALQAGEDVRAKQGLMLASQIAPGEPATWTNLGLLELRQQQYDAAIQHLETARTLAPQEARIQVLLGLIEDKRGNLRSAIVHLKEAVRLAPANVKALYALAQEVERQGSPAANLEARQLLQSILQAQPNNQAVLLDYIRLSAKTNNAVEVNNALKTVTSLSAKWSEPARRQLEAIRIAESTNIRSAAIPVQFLRNLLVRDVAFRQDLDAVRPPAGTLGEPILRFLRVTAPTSLPAASDRSLAFSLSPATATPDATWAGSLVLDAKADARAVWADIRNLHLDQGSVLPLPGNTPVTLNPHSITFGDLNYDFKTDIVMATRNGLRIYQQALTPLFTDVTSKTRLAPAVIHNSYTGAWLFDVDMDGDLDILLGSPAGPPVVLRNNGDGSFAVLSPFNDVDGVTAFATADFDGDADPDVAMLDKSGKLHVFSNERLGNYRAQVVPQQAQRFAVLGTGDINGDGLMDLVLLAADGQILRFADSQFRQILKSEPSATSPPTLLLADLDNNGSLDVLAGNQVFLHDSLGFAPLSKTLSTPAQTLIDINNDGRLDIVTLSGSLINSGSKKYKWQIIRTRAAQTAGDQRINSYGIGGEVEVRSGLLTQKQNITSPFLHFGLGENTEVSLARIVWPNGQLQVEFDLKPDATALAQQRLKGSCPFLFAWDGTRMRFVKDCAPWSPALGLHVNAQKVAGIGQTEEWFKIPGDQVKPIDGVYDLRVTAEYWETFYIDGYSFLAVDHPANTEVFTDERFAIPPPALKLYVTATTQPFKSLHDDNGSDVSDTLKSVDGSYLDTFGRGRYQGVTRDHWVELELPESAPKTGPLYLIGTGWVHPTDATINVALGQGTEPSPQGMSLEVVDASGGWHIAQTGLGFPAGRLKTVVLDLSHVFLQGAPRRLRLRTNLEIYWDKLAWAAAVPDDQLRVHHLGLASAQLDYRGFSRMSQANASSPELPDYGSVTQRGPRWHDLEGYYTRYGDVLPLIAKVDDRILITNAGDELQLKIPAPPAPPTGWTRDLIMIGDGWIKDGDFNSVFSKTVLPLPYHGLKEYTVDSRSLEEDPAYKLNPEDWTSFHTRYVSPELFTRALWQSQ